MATKQQVIAQSKNPRTTLGKMEPTMVAYHAAWAAIDAHRKVLEQGPPKHNHVTRDIKPPGQCPACDLYHHKERT